MATVPKRLGDLLVSSGLITVEQLKEALEEQKKTRQKLGDIFIQKGFITEQQLIEVLEFQLGIPHINLFRLPIDPAIVRLIPEALARKYQAIPVRKEGNKLLVAMVDPLDYYCIEDLRMVTGFSIQPAICTKEELGRAIARYYGLQESVENLAPESGSEDEIEETEILNEDSPVVRLVNQMLQQAVHLRASDIHIDPQENRVLIRYRIDGQLRTERVLARQMLGMMVARIKIMANLNIAERRVPQDGRFKMQVDYKTIDVRVSSLPTVHGEKVVLRILDLQSGVKELEKLGLSEHNLSLFKSMIERPYGMILITGPTGSGKTTTLYSAMFQLNHENVNIITVEDPVEYQLEGINQVQVNPVTGLTFAAGLRAILRQDPNIIMVGEIRDNETAEIAVRASLTGHLVLSTIHTNDAVSTITRLMDMGIEPYLIASSLIGIVSQRLVRRICPECKESYIPVEQERIFLDRRGGGEVERLYRGKGCGACNMTGYRGRIAIHEVLYIDDELRRMISNRASQGELREAAMRKGLIPLPIDGITKVKSGLTTLQEVIRETMIDRIQ